MNYLHEDSDGENIGELQLFNILPKTTVIRRFPLWSGRRYFSMKDGQVWLGIGATTWKSHRMPSSKYLLDWYKSNGQDSDEISSDLSNVGTFFHYLAGELVTAYANHQQYKISKTKIAEDLRQFMLHKGMNMFDHAKYSSILTKYLFSVAQWLVEWDFRVESVEFPVLIWELNVATAIDIVGTCLPPNKIGNAEPTEGERVRVCVNIKTRLKAQNAYPDDAVQLGVEKAAYNAYCPTHPADYAAVLCPVYTAASGSSYKFVFMDGYTRDDMELDFAYWQKAAMPDIEMQRFLNPQKFLDAPYDEAAERILDFSSIDKSFGKKVRGKPKEGYQTIRSFCESFFTENHV